MTNESFHPDAGNPEEWEPVDLTVRRPPGAVLSVRIPGDLAADVDDYAREHSLTLSETVRRGLEYLVHGAPVRPSGIGATAHGSLVVWTPTLTLRPRQLTFGRDFAVAFRYGLPRADGSEKPVADLPTQ